MLLDLTFSLITLPLFSQALISAFILMTQDNWDTNMKYTMTMTNYVMAALFTMIVIVIGVYVVLNLCLAVLLGNLDQLEDVPDKGDEEDMDVSSSDNPGRLDAEGVNSNR